MRTTFGDRSFTVAGPCLWNSLPATLRQITSYIQVRRHLKTFIWGLENHGAWWPLFCALCKYTYLLTYLHSSLLPLFTVRRWTLSFLNNFPSAYNSQYGIYQIYTPKLFPLSFKTRLITEINNSDVTTVLLVLWIESNKNASIRWQDSALPISDYWPTSEPNAG